LALVQRLPRGMANTVQAMKQHEAGAKLWCSDFLRFPWDVGGLEHGFYFP
jgi:hypothetical protein